MENGKLNMGNGKWEIGNGDNEILGKGYSKR